MSKVLAVNGSPRMVKGRTEMLLAAFLRGMQAVGADTDTIYPSRMKIERCDCNQMLCWFGHPGRCSHKDDMEAVLAQLREVDTVVIASPVYVPLPGALQDFINRMCPLMDPLLVTRDGRTRARAREGMAVRRFVAVVTGSWWEKENADTVIRIVRELAEDTGVEFAGALVRPHAELIGTRRELSPAGAEVLAAAVKAGRQLVEDGAMASETLAGR